MRALVSICLVLLLTLAAIAQAQQPLSAQQSLPPDGQPIASAKVVRLDPHLTASSRRTRKLTWSRARTVSYSGRKRLGSEGQGGYLLFSDIVANVIYKWTPATQELSVFLNNAGYTARWPTSPWQLSRAQRPLYVFDFGSNGIARDPQGASSSARKGIALSFAWRKMVPARAFRSVSGQALQPP